WDYFRCTGKPDGAQKVTEYWREGESEPYRVQRTCNWTYEGEPPPAPQPPPPPTAPDVRAFAEASGLIPDLEVHLNPPQGLVAMDTWLWFQHEAELTIEVPDLQGWSGRIDLQVEYSWDMGDRDDSVVRSRTPGEYGDPSATYVYQRACYCTVTVTATWTGTFAVTYNGFLDHEEAIEPIVYREAVEYPVFEAQAINIP
ncbi:MAG: PKD domain-containing protein, partial [Acidimicrobiales bacterium]